MKTFTDIVAVRAVVVRAGLRVDCPFCYGVHVHGGAGQRRSHCDGGADYRLILDPEDLATRKVENVS